MVLLGKYEAHGRKQFAQSHVLHKQEKQSLDPGTLITGQIISIRNIEKSVYGLNICADG